MLWQELDVSRDLSDGELIAAWSTVFNVDPDSVSVVDTIEDTSPVSETGSWIVIERWRQAGQFPLHVVAYVRGADLERSVSTPEGSLDLIRRFCSAVDSDCLLSDEDVNPYTMLLMRRTGELASVALDGDALDRDELVLATGRSAEAPVTVVGRGEARPLA